MFTSYLRSSFSLKRTTGRKKQTITAQDYELLRQTRVCFKPNEPLQQPLAPLDLFPFVFREYMPWAAFFKYDIDFQRLVAALRKIAQKYLILCGRLCTDNEGRYVIEVGSKKEKKYDFPVSELKAEKQMAEAILHHGKISIDSAGFQVHPDKLSFYLEALDFETIRKGQDSFLSVKLTHFSDGCCLAISICHLLADGMRFSELYRDISRAYCGKEVSGRDINRQYMTFEGFSQHFTPEDKEGCAIPETMPTGREPLTLKQSPNESSSLEILYLSKELINDMKSRVAPFIPEGSFVSTADLLQALLWMLDCELIADCGEITNSTDLGITGTSSVYMAELHCNGHGIILSNYLGNAIIVPHINADKDLESKTLIELLALLALRTRQKQVELKQHPKEVFKLLVGTCFPFTSFPDNELSAVSNFCKFKISDTDFGRGPTSFFLYYPILPISSTAWVVSPVLHDDSILLSKTVTTRQKERLEKSYVLNECAPGVKSLFDDFGTAELNKLTKQ